MDSVELTHGNGAGRRCGWRARWPDRVPAEA